jgi:hypothetical protein
VRGEQHRLFQLWRGAAPASRQAGFLSDTRENADANRHDDRDQSLLAASAPSAMTPCPAVDGRKNGILVRAGLKSL